MLTVQEERRHEDTRKARIIIMVLGHCTRWPPVRIGHPGSVALSSVSRTEHRLDCLSVAESFVLLPLIYQFLSLAA